MDLAQSGRERASLETHVRQHKALRSLSDPRRSILIYMDNGGDGACRSACTHALQVARAVR